jgi:hypothetical protein
LQNYCGQIALYITVDDMKSIKKLFRIRLSEVAEVAMQLLLLAEDVTLMKPIQVFAVNVLQACQALEHKADQLHKSDFVQQIIGDDALLLLEEVVDNDLVSALEEMFAKALRDENEPQINQLLQQLLDKVEKKLAVMNLHIQQLGELLNE